MRWLLVRVLCAIILCCICGGCGVQSEATSAASESAAFVSQADEQAKEIVRRLIPTGEILSYAWENPEEIAADDLVNLCAYNNLLGLPLRPANGTIAGGAEYDTPYKAAPADEVEQAIQKWFDVSAEHLRTSSLYQEGGHTYTMLCGWGGGWSHQAYQSEMVGDQLKITVWLVGQEIAAKPEGVLTVALSDGELAKYLSYALLDGGD